MTAQPQPRTRFRKAIEGRWVFHAELAAREMQKVTLAEALELVCLFACQANRGVGGPAVWDRASRVLSASSPQRSGPSVGLRR